jgi:hypothetical protein
MHVADHAQRGTRRNQGYPLRDVTVSSAASARARPSARSTIGRG